MKNDTFYMKKALQLAARAAQHGEIPIGALLVKEGEIVSRGYNLRETKQRPTGHAELLVIEKGAKKLGSWRLENTQLYVTLEPCLMCWGAILLARIPKVIFGAMDPKAGVCGSVLSLHEEKRFNHSPEVIGGVMENECGEVLSRFFRKLRDGKGRII